MLYSIKEKLIKLFKTNKQNPFWKNEDLITIMSNLYLIKNIYYRLKRQWASFNPKIQISHKIDIRILKRLKDEIKTGNYNWSNYKIVKNNFIFNFKDKIVKKLIEIVLHTIYKPNFQALVDNQNFNYRKDTHSIINWLKTQTHEWTYAFKNKNLGDDWSLNNKKFLKILKKKINDFKFLNIIKNLLKSSVCLENKMANFIFYNIYMHEFDLYVSKKIKGFNNKNVRKNFNIFESCRNSIIKSTYNKQKDYLLKKIITRKCRFNAKEFNKLKNYMKINKRKRIRLEVQKKWHKNSRIIYHRFNNHWIIFTDYCLHYMKVVKKSLIVWLKKKLKINVDKILLINLIKNKLNYLGFTIFVAPSKIKNIYYDNRVKARRKKNVFIFIGIDHKSLRSKLIKKKIITPKYRPNYVNSYYSLKPLQVVLKFKQKLKILWSYYYNIITYPYELNYYYYIYKFSCLKTLADKIKDDSLCTYNVKISNFFKKSILTNNSSTL